MYNSCTNLNLFDCSNLDLHAPECPPSKTWRDLHPRSAVFLHHCPRDVPARQSWLLNFRVLRHHPLAAKQVFDLLRIHESAAEVGHCMDLAKCTPSESARRFSSDLSALPGHISGRQRSSVVCCVKSGTFKWNRSPQLDHFSPFWSSF